MERLSLRNEEFEGENNAYLLEGDDLALVDTGVATDAVRADLRAGLAEHGYAFADLDHVVLTHFHPDHAGLAGEIQAESDATVFVHEADAPLVSGEGIDAFERLRRERLEEWGLPDEELAGLLAFFERADYLFGEFPTVTPIADGDVLEVGGLRLETIHAPGHTAGLCCFEIEEGSAVEVADGAPTGTSRKEAFVGDAVLPVYTPNVGGADVRVERPLATYVETLRRLADREYDLFWPGHRDPIDEPTARVLEIVSHHRDRTARVIDVLQNHGPADAWTVSARLFGDLEGIHVLHGPGEAYAHLDHLVGEGVAAVEDGEYRLLENDVGVEELFPSNA